MRISVVIPAYNRPALLLEAVASVAAQTHAKCELVIVDDGSDPPIDRASVERAFGRSVTFIRHSRSQGVARAKNAGVWAAGGEVVTLLDDDDLLKPHALQRMREVYECHRDLDCVFLGVEPFGTYASGVAERRKQAVGKIVAEAGREVRDGLHFFDDRLFAALVRAVPIDFQRPAARRGTWNIVGGFDETGAFSESAWAVRAAARCRVALTVDALTRWRIHDSNFGWAGDDARAGHLRQADNVLTSAQALVARFRAEHRLLGKQLQLLEGNLSESYFGKAYVLADRPSRAGLGALARACAMRPRTKHFKLMLRYLLPALRKG
ncbi:MAG TPA: glycosyltransferase family 2 protein [Burkholderiaceae bacterium]|nr:glycosyltransferase family 2 protein [Burkholderiaceae bacterium]